jgi:hypothetical protein
MALKKKQGYSLLQWNRGDEQLIPDRFRALLNAKTTVTQVPTDVEPAAMSITTVASKLRQTRTDERELSTTTIDDPVGKVFVDYRFDKTTGLVLPVEHEIVAKPTGGDIPTGIDAGGFYYEYTGLTDAIGIRTKTSASSWTRTYTVAEHVTLPRVLTSFHLETFLDRGFPYRNPYNQLDSEHPEFQSEPFITPGPTISSVQPYFELTDFSGSYVLTVTESWQKDAFTDLAPTLFQPRGISWASPFGSVSIPPCLHGSVTYYYSTGTEHPRFSYMVGSYAFPATSPANLSGTIIVEDTQHPYEGGYRRITKSFTL